MSERSLRIAGELGKWSAIVTIMACFILLLWLNWPDPVMLPLVSFLAGMAFERMTR